MLVKFKATGQVGMLPDNEYDPTLYEAVGQKLSTPSTQPQQTPAKPEGKSLMGFLGNAGSDIGNMAQGLWNLPGNIVNAAGEGKLGELGSNMVKGVGQEYNSLLGDPISENGIDFKKLLGLGLLPIAPGLGNQLNPGVAEHAYQHPVNTAVDILPGLQEGKAGQVANAAEKTGGVLPKISTRIMDSVFKEPIKNTKASIKGGESLGKEALNRGLTGSTESIYTKATTKINELEDQLQNTLMGSDKKVPIADVKATVKPLVDEYMQAGNTKAAQSILDRINAIEEQNGAQVPAALANQIKRTLYDEAKKSYGTEASANMEGIKGIARGLKESLGKIPGVEQINKDLSFYGRAANSMLDKMTREQRNNILGLTDSILGAGGIASGAGLPAIGGIMTKNALGSTLGKTAIANGLNKLGQIKAPSLPPITGPAAAQVANQSGSLPPIVQPSGQVSAGDYSQEDPTQQSVMPGSDNTSNNNNQQQGNNNGSLPPITGYTQEQLGQAYSKALMANDKASAAQLKQMYDMEAAYQKQNAPKKPKALSAQQIKDVNLAKNGIRGLDVIKTKLGYDKTTGQVGPNAVGKVSQLRLTPFNLGDRELKKAIFDAAGARLRLESGAALSPDEIKRYVDEYIGQLGDNPAALNYEIQQLDDYLTAVGNQQSDVPDITIPDYSQLPPISMGGM